MNYTNVIINYEEEYYFYIKIGQYSDILRVYLHKDSSIRIGLFYFKNFLDYFCLDGTGGYFGNEYFHEKMNIDGLVELHSELLRYKIFIKNMYLINDMNRSLYTIIKERKNFLKSFLLYK